MADLTTWLFEYDHFAPVAKLTTQGSYSIITDHLDNPLELYGQGGKTWQAQLDSYGQVRQGQGKAQDCPFRYQGQYEDTETGLYYNRFRYYDPEVGCYISQDPIRLEGGSTLYSYIHNPTSWTDVFGMNGNPLIVIGEGQKRVNQVAKQLRSQGYTVRTITDDWSREFKTYNPYVPELHEPQSIDYNRRWINDRMDENYDVYDIGGEGKSPFYKAEHEEIMKREYAKHYRFDPKTGGKGKIIRLKKCGFA